jgi:hypothetical protein
MSPLARIAALVGSLSLAACMAGAAGAAPSADLRVNLNPEKAGGSTTITFAFTIGPANVLPSALTRLNVHLPFGMGIDISGLARCARAPLLAHGASACRANARVGAGSVRVRVPLGNVIRPETAILTVFKGPRQGGRETLLFFAAGKVPIATRIVFTGVIVPSPHGLSIEAAIPLIPTLPESPDASIVEMTSTVGTRRGTYSLTPAGRRTRFTPKGATLPRHCPTTGLPFSADFHFNDASNVTARATAGCRG